MEGDRGARPGRTGGGRGREAGAEMKQGIVCCLLLGIISQKHLPSKVLKFPINIHQCLKENFGSKKT